MSWSQDADTQIDVCMTSQMANQIELWTRMYENRSPWVNKGCTQCEPGTGYRVGTGPPGDAGNEI